MKYRITLADNYTLPGPFITDWNLELIGDKLREEFQVYLEEHKKAIGYVEGSSKTLIIPLILQRFMNLQKISLVEDPATGGLISRFVLRKGETKLIDERAANALHVFKRREVVNKEGEFENWLGFIEIEKVARGPKERAEKAPVVNVIGEDVNYFEPEAEEGPGPNPKDYPGLQNVVTPDTRRLKDSTVTSAEVAAREDKLGLYCDKCKRSFKAKIGYDAHMRMHKSAAAD